MDGRYGKAKLDFIKGKTVLWPPKWKVLLL